MDTVILFFVIRCYRYCRMVVGVLKTLIGMMLVLIVNTGRGNDTMSITREDPTTYGYWGSDPNNPRSFTINTPYCSPFSTVGLDHPLPYFNDDDIGEYQKYLRNIPSNTVDTKKGVTS
mmetsp:Transcript_20854/g.21233  ORF Transcript_20854/g.21233 Transcript_20854/m.21233 type:complete len:118 (-) Transcript_20854:940-1293(-)